MHLPVLLAALTLLPAMPAGAAPPQRHGPAALERMLQGRVAGKPVSCINLALVGSSEVVDGTAIVYRRGSRLYVNRPQHSDRALDHDVILATRIHGSSLCSGDAVDLVDRYSGVTVGFVLLGDFEPYNRVRTARK